MRMVHLLTILQPHLTPTASSLPFTLPYFPSSHSFPLFTCGIASTLIVRTACKTLSPEVLRRALLVIPTPPCHRTTDKAIRSSLSCPFVPTFPHAFVTENRRYTQYQYQNYQLDVNPLHDFCYSSVRHRMRSFLIPSPAITIAGTL